MDRFNRDPSAIQRVRKSLTTNAKFENSLRGGGANGLTSPSSLLQFQFSTPAAEPNNSIKPSSLSDSPPTAIHNSFHRRDSDDNIDSPLLSGRRSSVTSSITTAMGPTSSSTSSSSSSSSSAHPTTLPSHGSFSSSGRLLLHTAPRRSSVSKGSMQNDKQPARLVYQTAFGGKMNFLLLRDETAIGRKEDNHIVLTCAKISKYHAVITRNDFGFWLKDRNSSNGVRVNGSLIDPSEPIFLTEGDEIQIGTILMIFHDEIDKSLVPPISSATAIASESGLGNYDGDEEELSPISSAGPEDLVTILPSEQKYEETVTIRAEIDAIEDTDFRNVSDVTDVSTLKEDYEKLRLAYELSKISLTNDINELFAKMLDMIFELLPVDRGVVLLVDQHTGLLATQYVKLRPGKGNEKREILLSSTILKKVFYSRTCLVTSDACEDPTLGQASSIKFGQIRSVICVPLISHNKVHGILHLDSRERINTFSSKDVGIVKAICNQTAMAIENSILMKEVESKVKMTEQLRRFLAPQVVERMVNRQDMIKRGGRDVVGTIVFADIRGFTNISEKCEPSEVVMLLNDYFERVSFLLLLLLFYFINSHLLIHFTTKNSSSKSCSSTTELSTSTLVTLSWPISVPSKTKKIPNTAPLLLVLNS